MLFFEAGGVEVCGPFLVRERWALLSDLQPYRVCSQGGESHGRIQNVPVRFEAARSPVQGVRSTVYLTVGMPDDTQWQRNVLRLPLCSE